jgi:hypothetical protein
MAASAKAQEPKIAGNIRNPLEAQLAKAAAAAQNRKTAGPSEAKAETKSAFAEPAPEPNHSWCSSITSCCTPDPDEELEGSYADCPCYTAFMLSCMRCVGSSISYLAGLIGHVLSYCMGTAASAARADCPKAREFVSKWDIAVIPATDSPDYPALRMTWHEDLNTLEKDARNYVCDSFADKCNAEIRWPEGKENTPAGPNGNWSPAQEIALLRAIESDVGSRTVLNALEAFLET